MNETTEMDFLAIQEFQPLLRLRYIDYKIDI